MWRDGGWKLHVGVFGGMVGGRRKERWVGRACRCVWWDGGWEVHVVYLEEWWCEVHVGVFGKKVGGMRMRCIWTLEEW
jgi:hypothetical protein